jgi:hypothetical protein
VKELLAIPDGFATACHIAVGYPTHPFPTELKRRPVEGDRVRGAVRRTASSD